MSDLIKEGGQFGIRRVGRDQYTIPVPQDADGRTDRECPQPDCSPGYFKVKMGTGLKDTKTAFCPYCCHEAEAGDFHTQDQVRFVTDVMKREAHAGMARMLHQSLGLNSSGSRDLGGGGLFKISLNMDPPRLASVSRPLQEIVRRDVVCPHCTLDQSVFGLATWCSDCGRDIFTTHVLGEINVIKAMMGDVDRRLELLGGRVAAKDMENGLEDLVSVFEATLKIEIRRHLRKTTISEESIDVVMRKIGSRLQSISHAVTLVHENCGAPLSIQPQDDLDRLTRIFEKRHPITHNLGVIDKKYLERVQSHDALGKDISLTEREIIWAADAIFVLIDSLHQRLFPQALPPQQDEQRDPPKAARAQGVT
jgi:hypothetical protein